MADWFRKQFGFSEIRYDQTQAKFKYDGRKLTSLERRDRTFIAGPFETPSLEQLRERGDADPFAKKDLAGRLRVCEVIGDVTSYHVDPANKFALFQAASQFNCLEHTSESGLPEHGIGIYERDRTQGPACAISCGPGTVARNYFAFGDRGQTRDKQVENLGDAEYVIGNRERKPPFFTVQNGYTMANNGSLAPLKELLKDNNMCKKVLKEIRIGVQSDTEVTSSEFGRKTYEGAQQLVTQCYCSAISVSYSRADASSWEPFARLVLLAAYEATMYAAVENAMRHKGEPGARRVYLTALGGGVFGNPMPWIIDAMRSAFQKFEKFGFEVYLVSFGSSEQGFVELAREFPLSEEAS